VTPLTVCVPSYRSAPFIRSTLASVAAQTHTDFKVVLGLEPDGAAETLAAAREFLADPRFAYQVNERTLGYAGNVRQLMARVDTPLFTFLPHDDLIHPRYLEAQIALLEQRPDAVATFAEEYNFGEVNGFRAPALVDGALYERLLAFMLDGAEGNAWRGLTRRVKLTQPYPDNEFNGFAVECEWALQMLLAGPVLPVAEPLYLLRRHPAGGPSVSVAWRTQMQEGQLRRALEHHHRRLLELVAGADLTPQQARIVELAADAAALRRWVLFAGARFDFGDDGRARWAALIAACEGISTHAARQVLARAHYALSVYASQRGRTDTALQHAQAAFELDAAFGDAALQLATVLLARGDVMAAISAMERAAALLPMAIRFGELEAHAARLMAALGGAADRVRAA
jgi:tetratricopeptide (TPR) repeat protein